MAWLAAYDGERFDFVFVDTTVTKFDRRDLVFRHLNDGALFVPESGAP